MEPGVQEVVLVHLAEVGARGDADPGAVPAEATVAGIGDVLGFDRRGLAGRVELLSALDELTGDGLVTERDAVLEGRTEPATAYVLTDGGERRAAAVRDAVLDREVTITGEAAATVRLADVDEYLPAPALSRALARLTDDGTVRVGSSGETFVNRETELAALETLVDRVAGGDPAAVLVEGAAGVGKTTLVTDQLADLARSADLGVSVGRCQAELSDPYRAVREALGDVLERDPFATDGVAPTDASQLEAERTAMFGDVVDAVAAATEDAPAMVVVDDLHSADGPTLGMFSYLARHLEGAVLLVGTYRGSGIEDDHPVADLAAEWPEATPDSGQSGAHLSLEPFGRDDTRQLVESTLDRHGVPAGFVDLVFDLTAGNPLFVTESVTRLVQEGTVDPDHDVYPERPSEIPISPEVEETIDVRLSVLDEATHDVLELGGVIGQTIPYEVLVAAAGRPESDLRKRVDLLVDSGVWEWAEGGTSRLRFASGLTRETVFDRIDDERRRDLHRRIADAVEAEHPDDPDYYTAIAYNYRQAGEHERAFTAFVRAADHAKDVYAHESALDDYDRALELARDHLDRSDDDPDVLSVLEESAETYYLLGEYEEADRYYRYVRDRATDPERLRRIAHVRADILDSQGRYAEAEAVATEAIEEYGVADTVESRRLYGMQGGAYLHMGEYDAAETAFQRCLEIAERIDEPEALAAAYLDLGALDLVRGEADDETRELLERAVSVAEDSEEDRALPRALNNLGGLYVQLGRIEDAEAAYERCFALRDEMGDRVQIAKAHGQLGHIKQEKGEFDRAREEVAEAIDIAESVDNPQVLVTNYQRLASIHHTLGELDAAVDRTREALAVADRLDNPGQRVSLLTSLADRHVDRGDFDRGRELAEEALEVAAEVGEADRRWGALAVLGNARHATDDSEGAREAYAEALSVARDGDALGDAQVAVSRARLAAVARKAGDVDVAREHLAAAEEAAEAAEQAVVRLRIGVQSGALARVRDDYDEAAAAVEDVLETSREPRHRSPVIECRAALELARIEQDRGRTERANQFADQVRRLAREGGIGRYRPALRDLEASLADA